MARVVIDREWCKGCGLCVHVCPNQGLITEDKLNEKGYFPAKHSQAVKCTGCGMCVLVCPEMAIEIVDDEDI